MSLKLEFEMINSDDQRSPLHIKQKPTDETKLGFGKIFTDYMLMMRYDRQEGGWYSAKIMPYGDISLSPASLVLHYAQECFEGLKAYRLEDGQIQLFRPWDNVARLQNSANRLCMVDFPHEFLLESIYKLVDLERDWVPGAPGTSLYIRPTFIGIDPYVGLKTAEQYMLFVILSPVGAYYPGGLAPVDIFVEQEYVRAVKGGLGQSKSGANYAASIKAGVEAIKKGYTQVLWLDGKENKYVDEVGSMNIFFKIDGKLITPALLGSILPGITRDSIIKLAIDMGISVEQRPISIDEIYAASLSGTLEEVFGSGTAAVVSPVGRLIWGEKEIIVGDGKMGGLTTKLYNTLTGIQYGKLEDKFGWTKIVSQS